MERMIAFCGLNCAECPAYLATQADDDDKREEVAEKWSSDELSLTKEDINCDGCLAFEGRQIRFCADCEVRSCGIYNDVDNCSQCADYPCDKLRSLWQMIKDPSAKANLEEMKKAGWPDD